MRRLMSVELAEAPQPTLKAQLTMAPYWLALRRTAEPVCRVMQFWATYTGDPPLEHGRNVCQRRERGGGEG